MQMLDVAVVGAGAAGIAAGHRLREVGLSTVLLEAEPRVGGRALTEHHHFAWPVDLGCHWLHSADRNPLRQEAARLGFEVWQRAAAGAVFGASGWLSPGELDEYEAYCRLAWRAIEEAGAAGQDVAATQVIPRDARWQPLFSSWCAALSGLEPEELSTLDHYRYLDTGCNWPLPGGMGALIARLADRLPLRLSCPVARLDWSGDGVRLQTRGGLLRARAAIVTVSSGVLSAGGLRFAPALPLAYQEAFDAATMGHACKVIFQVLKVQPDTLDLPSQCYAQLDVGSAETAHYHLRPFGRDLVFAYAAGRFGEALEHAGPDAMVDFALEQLTRMYGSNVRRALHRPLCTDWATRPSTLGAYSSARPGHASCREQLNQPLGGHVFFAGEATSLDAYGTAHGAWLSGIAAADRVGQALRPSFRCASRSGPSALA